jgi:hypothetical protein
MASVTEFVFATLFQGKGKGKGKGRGKTALNETEQKKKTGMKIKDWPQIHKKLRCLDVFAGCGGMSSYLPLFCCLELMKKVPLLSLGQVFCLYLCRHLTETKSETVNSAV